MAAQGEPRLGGTNARPIQETLAETGPGLPDEAVGPEQRTLPEQNELAGGPEAEALERKLKDETLARWRAAEPSEAEARRQAPSPPFVADGPAPEQEGQFPVGLKTPEGEIRGRLHLCPGAAAVLWVFGSGGGLGGPAGGLYTRLGGALRQESIASLELAYRHPGELADCVRDVGTGLAYLESLGKRRIVLVGHSFGGAVVIEAAAGAPQVVAVAALSSQLAGTDKVAELSPRPVLFVHGEEDEVLPSRCATELYARAREPKEIILYPGCRHGLDQCRPELDRDLLAWVRRVAPAA
jgi:hypothetical protein